MRIPLTKYGRPQVIILPALVLITMVLCLLAGKQFFSLRTVYSIETILAVLLICTLLFFRDPRRTVPTDSNLLLAPADGKVIDIETVQENNFVTGPAIKIGIFLSIFDVHINRAPCNVTVEKIAYKKGIYKDARNPDSTGVNESNNLFLVRMDEPKDKLLLRQISGTIARRIVCAAQPGQNLTGGEKFGMIKFGSRTELYIPVRENITPLVKTGDKVKAGLTPLIRYQ